MHVIELVVAPDGNRAEADFTPTQTGTYAIYLGTPNVGFAVADGGRVVSTTCARYLSRGLAMKLTGVECPDLLGVYQLALTGGTTYTLYFGPISPQRWVRVYLQSEP
ncbi:MAG: hypothetical protein K0R38_3814 [Polyangiaceae bacterium]|nr:hypothetical protein [Polyangiaceae bacterium]